MLLRFGVSNFRSIRDYQEMSLIASGLKDSPEHLLALPSNLGKALPVAALYGANASGKSNMLQALGHLVTAILNPQTG